MAFGAPAGRGNDFWITSHADAAGAVDRWVAILPRKCKLLGIRAVWDTVGGASAAVQPRRVTADGQAPDAVAGASVIELTSAVIDLTATANTVVEPTIVTADRANYFDEGDRLGESYTGTVTGLVGAVIVYHFLALGSSS